MKGTTGNMDIDIAAFQLYFPTLAITQHRQQEDYSSNQFVSELGGAAGLVLGVSLVSIIRMIDCFISRTLDIHRDTAGACFNISIPANEKDTDKVYFDKVSTGKVMSADMRCSCVGGEPFNRRFPLVISPFSRRHVHKYPLAEIMCPSGRKPRQ